MTDSNKIDLQDMDDALAEFTDQVLKSHLPDDPQPAGADDELRRLQRTVLHLHGAIDTSAPDPAMQRRIRTNLRREWERQHADRPSIVSRLRLLFTPAPRPALAFSLVCLVVALLAVALALLPPGTIPLTGAAGSGGGNWPALAAGLLVALAALIYILRRRS